MRATLSHTTKGIPVHKADDGRELVAVETIAGPMWIDAADFFRFGGSPASRSSLESAERAWARKGGE